MVCGKIHIFTMVCHTVVNNQIFSVIVIHMYVDIIYISEMLIQGIYTDLESHPPLGCSCPSVREDATKGPEAF